MLKCRLSASTPYLKSCEMPVMVALSRRYLATLPGVGWRQRQQVASEGGPARSGGGKAAANGSSEETGPRRGGRLHGRDPGKSRADGAGPTARRAHLFIVEGTARGGGAWVAEEQAEAVVSPAGPYCRAAAATYEPFHSASPGCVRDRAKASNHRCPFRDFALGQVIQANGIRTCQKPPASPTRTFPPPPR